MILQIHKYILRFKMLCIYTTLYTFCFSIFITSLAYSSQSSFLISFMYSRAVSFACVSRTLRCHNPYECLPPFIYSRIISFACIFRTLRRHNPKERLLISCIYSRFIYFTYIFRTLRCHNPNECLHRVISPYSCRFPWTLDNVLINFFRQSGIAENRRLESQTKTVLATVIP